MSLVYRLLAGRKKGPLLAKVGLREGQQGRMKKMMMITTKAASRLRLGSQMSTAELSSDCSVAIGLHGSVGLLVVEKAFAGW